MFQGFDGLSRRGVITERWQPQHILETFTKTAARLPQNRDFETIENQALLELNTEQTPEKA